MKVKCLLKSVLPCLAALFLTVIAYFAAFALSVIFGLTDINSVEGALVDEGLFNLLRFVLIILFFGILFLRNKPVGKTIKEGLLTIKKPQVFLTLIIIGLALQIVVTVVLLVFADVFQGVFSEYKLMERAIFEKMSVMYIIAAAILGPIAEELVFRRFTLDILKEEFNIWIAIVVQALIFGVYHGNIIQFVYATLMGVLFGYLVKRYNSIVPGLLMHMVVNASFFLLPLLGVMK